MPTRIFNKSNYNSNNGFLVTVWGPLIWTFLHIMSFNYPTSPTPENKKHYMDFILSLQHILPCGHCRTNLTNNFKKFPITMKHMKNRETFSRYVYELHEHVNKMLHKTSNLSYCEVRARYENFRSRCNTPKNQQIKKEKHTNKTHKHKKESGCVDPLYGKKAKSVISIVPQTLRCKTLKIDSKCITKRKKRVAT